MFRRIALILLLLGTVVPLAAACSKEPPPAPKVDTTPTTGGTPAPLTSGGNFLICTDVPYPPAEYQSGTNYVGYEIEIMNQVATKLQTRPVYTATPFSGITAALDAHKCDAIMSSMNVTPEREQKMAMTEYLQVGQSMMVLNGSTLQINSLNDLAGLRVGAQAGPLRGALYKKNVELQATGAAKMKIGNYPDAATAIASLQAGKIDVVYADSPVVADYVNRMPDQFAFAGAPINALSVGIAVRKSDVALANAIADAVQAMYKDGSMKQILERWHITDFSLPIVRDSHGNTISIDPDDMSVQIAQGGTTDSHGETAGQQGATTTPVPGATGAPTPAAPVTATP
jgi:polar amino acid transport system substrate-binding protein